MYRSLGFDRAAVAVVTLAVLALGTPLFADEALPDGATVMDKFVDASGGKDAYDKIDNRLIKGTFEMPAAGISMDLTIYAAKPNVNYTLGESEAMGRFEQGTDGEIAWEVSTMSGARFMEGEEKADTMRNAIFDATAYWRDVYETVETVGETACYKVVATPAGGSPQTMYFDQESGLLIQVETILHHSMGDIPIKSLMSEYQEVDGIKMPFHTTSSMMGQDRAITLTSVEHNVEMAADRFAVPEEVREILEIPEATRAED